MMTRHGLDLVAGAGRRARVSLLGLCILMAGATLPAQPLRWGPAGPRGGGISSLATVAGGAGVVWAAASGHGLWRSLDGGASWVQTSLADRQTYFAVATDLSDPLTVYAEGEKGLAKTNDGGATWSVIHPARVDVFAIAPSAPATLYLANREFGSPQPATFSRSDDGGATWRMLALPGIFTLFALAVDPANPDSVFAQGFSNPDFRGVFLHSTDGGKSWLQSSTPSGGSISSLQVDPRGAIYGVLSESTPVRSQDGGQTWEAIDAGLPPFVDLSGLVLERASGALYLTAQINGDYFVGTSGQVWRSVDGGTSWAKLVERSGALYPVVFDGASPGRLYVGTEDAGLLTSAGGGHWELAGPGFVPWRVTTLAADSRLPGTLYATFEVQHVVGFEFPEPPSHFGVSHDGGATWTTWTPRDQNGVPLSLDGSLVVDPLAAGSLYSVGFGLGHSADGGMTWSLLGQFAGLFAASLAVDPLHAGVLFAGSGGVLRSADGGQTWTQLLNLSQATVKAMLVDPTIPGAVFAGGTDGLWRSLDGGQTWTGLGGPGQAGGQGIVRLQIDAGHNLYAEVSPSGPDLHTLYRSTDRGTTWNPVDAGLPAGIQVNDLLIDPRGTAFYAGTSNGVYVSQDGGAHWTAAGDGLAASNVLDLKADSVHAGALVANTEEGLFFSPAGLCVPGDLVLCLSGGRFAARAHWSLPDGTAGDAHAAALTDGSGTFWFWSPQSVELTLKMLDGGAVNHRFWLFDAALTDVAYTLTVTEVATGRQRNYRSPGGRFANFADTDAFNVAPSASSNSVDAFGPLPARVPPAVSSSTAGCVPAADTLCLAGSRFAVRVNWSFPGTGASPATAVPLVQNTGGFWFFSPQLPELMVKVLDGRVLNGHFWVFLSGLSSVAYTATVTDTATGASKQYVHPAGALAAVGDTSF